ncbi:hypothetical protein MCUN1_000546 [Malassezia cuniculi]|uniref:Alpha/beta hydrolase fold-3 domain-containing protein n=1 Tax=Malassezia cuniculi TaxID=948313 RepID=A0AAF0J4S4_9BASI|nr:hypothetical protein MCUN1_000546 [Malassezia cuniculi]
MSTHSVDPAVSQAVSQAKIKSPCYVKYFIKAIFFHAYFTASLVILLPIFIIRSLIPGLGTWKNWSFMQALGVFLVRHTLKSFIRFRMQPLVPREHGLRESTGPVGNFIEMLNTSGPGGIVEGKGHFSRPDREWFPPPPLEAFRGIFSIKVPGKTQVESEYYNGPAIIEPKWANVRTRGFWFTYDKGPAPKKGPAGSQKRPIILFVHGGAGVTFGGGDPFLGQTLIKNLTETAKIDVISVDYFLAPHAPFPIQVVQALGVYVSLLRDYGYTPGQIYFAGDSFGGYTVMTLERYLRREGHFLIKDLDGKAPTQTGMPGNILLSPLLRPYYSDDVVVNKHDIIDIAYLDWGLDALKIGPGNPNNVLIQERNAYVSPYDTPSEEAPQLTPIFMVLARLEQLYDEDMLFGDRIKKAGGDITIHVQPDTVHDFGTMFPFIPEFKETCTKLAKWIHA